MAWIFHTRGSISAQITDRLKREILTGEYKSGEQFPTVRNLAEEAGVNPNTVQKSMAQLISEGLLVTKGTAGHFVTEDEEILSQAKITAIKNSVKTIVSESKVLSLSYDELIEKIKEEWDNV